MKAEEAVAPNEPTEPHQKQDGENMRPFLPLISLEKFGQVNVKARLRNLMKEARGFQTSSSVFHGRVTIKNAANQ